MVALKIIKPGMDTREVIARFEAERQALAFMEHPNIAKVLDAGATESGRPYFVMELVKGVPITEFCDQNRMPAAERLKLFVTVCHAIQHAHQKGVIHRDVKPSNVMVTLHDGVPVPKVIDFGVAKATAQRLTEKTLFTAYGQMVGTPAYMSPEQAEMSGLDIDTRSDIYSLGVLLYELLTGTTPLDSKRLRTAGYAEMQRLIREAEAPRPSTRLSSLGGEATILAGNRGTDPRRLVQLLAGDLDWIAMKALEKDRNRRYSSPGNFADDVGRYLRGEVIEARAPTPIYRFHKFVRRNQVFVYGMSAFLILVGLGLAGTGKGLLRAHQAERRARDDEARARQAEELAEARLIDVGKERDAANAARAEAVTKAGLLRLAVSEEESRRLSTQALAVRPGNPGQALLLAIAGAEKSTARSAIQNNALLDSLRECREERTFFAPPFDTPEGRSGLTSFVALKVTPDGSRAVVVGQRLHDPVGDFYLARAGDDSATVYDLTTGRVTASMKLPGLRFATMAISPDGLTLATATDQGVVIRCSDNQTVAYTDSAIRLWDIRSGKELKVLKGHADRVSSLCFDAKGQRLLSASWDKTARIWDVATGKAIHTLDGGPRSLDVAEFSPDGSRVVTVDTSQAMEGEKLADEFEGRTFPEPVRKDQVLIDPPVRSDVAIRWLQPLTMTRSGGGGNRSAPRLWDAQTGKQIADLAPPKAGAGTVDGPVAASFTADGTRVVTCDFRTTEFWDANDGKPISGVEKLRDVPGQPLKDGNRMLIVFLDSSGRISGTSRLLVWQSNLDRREWRRATSAERVARVGFWQDDRVTTRFLCATHAGQPLIARGTGDVADVYDVVTGQRVAARGHELTIAAGAMIPGSQRLVTAGHDGTVRIWNLDSRVDPVVEIKRANSPVVGYGRFVSSGDLVVTGPARDEYERFKGKSVSFWNARTGVHLADLADDESLATAPVHKELLGDLRDLDVAADGTRLVTVHKDLNPRGGRKEEPQPSDLFTPVRVWDVRTGKRLFALAGFRRSVATARFSPDGRWLLTFADGSGDYAILRDGKTIGSGGGGQLWARVDVWDAETGAHVRNLVPESKGGGDFAEWSADGKRVVTNALAHLANVAADVFNSATGERVCRLKTDGAGMDRGAFSLDGRLIFGYRARHLRDQVAVDVWDAVTGDKRATLRGHRGDVTSAAFAPDSRTVVTTSKDGTARLWDATTGEVRRVLRAHRDVVRTGRFSPDGKWVVTASTDGTARIWKAETGQEWMTLPASQGEMISAEFSADSQRVLTVSTDGVARIWPVDPLPIAATRKPRELTADERARFLIE
jgi:eukaryotic-like serine/threonine-protein kinase